MKKREDRMWWGGLADESVFDIDEEIFRGRGCLS